MAVKSVMIKDDEVLKIRMLLHTGSQSVQFEQSINLPIGNQVTDVLPLTFEQLEHAYNFMKP